MSDDATTGSGGNETGRIEAFSDGVFAIAITLLVLEIKVPHDLPDGRLASELWHLWPSYLAFITSFLTIGVMWVNHHRLFTLIRRSDQTLLILNTILLFGISFLPFPTAVVAEYLRRPDERVASVVYNGTFLLISIFFNILWRHVSKENRLLDPSSDARWVRGITRQYAFGPVYYLAAMLLAFVSVPASLGLNILLAIFFVLPAYRLPGMRRGARG